MAKNLTSEEIQKVVVAERPTNFQGVSLDHKTQLPQSVIPSGMALICDQKLLVNTSSFDTLSMLGGNIPQTYKNLVLELFVGTSNATQTTTLMNFNNDFSANGYSGYTNMNAAAVAAGSAVGQTWMTAGVLPPQISPGAAHTIRIPDYTNTGRTTYTFQSYSPGDSTNAVSGLFITNGGGHTLTNGAVTRIQIYPGAGNLLAGSRFTLYGLF
jgi:hypothetical protein